MCVICRAGLAPPVSGAARKRIIGIVAGGWPG